MRHKKEELLLDLVELLSCLILWPVSLTDVRSLSDFRLRFNDLKLICVDLKAVFNALFRAELSNMVPSFLWWPLAICYERMDAEDSQTLADISIVIFCIVFVLVSYFMSWSWVKTLARAGNAMLISGTVFRFVKFCISPCSSSRRRFTILPAGFDDWFDRSWFADLLEKLRSPFVTTPLYDYDSKDVLPSTHELTIRVENIVARIVDRIQKSGLGEDLPPVELMVVDRPYRQATATDAGQLTFFTGYLQPCDAAVAREIAHEIAHIISKHAEETENYSHLLCFVWAGLSFITFHPCVYFGSALLDFLLRMALSRRVEKEADYLGFLLAASAGYEPEEQLKSFAKDDEFLDWFATHPSEADRFKLHNNPQVLQLAKGMYHASIQT